MTCASCAARIQKKLNRLDGVTATVNFAIETARGTFPATVNTGEPPELMTPHVAVVSAAMRFGREPVPLKINGPIASYRHNHAIEFNHLTSLGVKV